MKWSHYSRFAKLALPVAAVTVMLTGCEGNYMVLNPAGPVGRTELHLILLSLILTLIVIIPVLVIFAWILVRYRDKKGSKAKYDPEWSENRKLEIVWWAIPIVVVAILGGITAKDTFSLTRPAEKNVAPLTIDVMSLNWKWVFLYPDQKVATVNYAEIPTGVPVQFVLTSDAPMNSFWVPQLGGQEYTMPGMALRLWLQADKPGDYYGHGANFTGEGFAGMKFDVIATSQDKFDAWTQSIKQSSPALTEVGYQQLTVPGNVGTESFSSFPQSLFSEIVMRDGGKYMNMDPSLVGNMPMTGMAGSTK